MDHTSYQKENTDKDQCNIGHNDGLAVRSTLPLQGRTLAV